MPRINLRGPQRGMSFRAEQAGGGEAELFGGGGVGGGGGGGDGHGGGAGGELGGHVLGHRVGVAPRYEGVHQPVIVRGDLLVGEAHAAEVGLVRRQRAQKSERAPRRGSGPGGVGFDDEQLLDDQGGPVP